MYKKRSFFSVLWAVLMLLLTGASSARAEASAPTGRLLVPYFELDVANDDIGTLFVVTNTSHQNVRADFVLFSNWGIEVDRAQNVSFKKFQEKTFVLRNWIVNGNRPGGGKVPDKDALRRKLRGEKVGGLFFATPAGGRATGYVKILERSSKNVLCGNYYREARGERFEEGEMLVDVQPETEELCDDHGVFLVKTANIKKDSAAALWTPRRLTDGKPDPAPPRLGTLTVFGYDANGNRQQLTPAPLRVIATQLLPIADLGWKPGILWLELVSDGETFVAAHYFDGPRGQSSALRTCCLDCDRPGGPGCTPQQPKPGIKIEKSTNGQDADTGRGPAVASGGQVTWRYRVTNTGGVALRNVRVSDDQRGPNVCSLGSLQPGETESCVETDTARCPDAPFDYGNVATAVGTPVTGGNDVSDRDPSHYHCQPPSDETPEIDVEKSTNGQDADTGRGPAVASGGQVTWRYRVTNTGSVTLRNVRVSDDQLGRNVCRLGRLRPGQAKNCVKTDTARCPDAPFDYANVATAVGTPVTGGNDVSDQDPSHYHCRPPSGNGFRTQTQGGWGTGCSGNNPGCIRDRNFPGCFPQGLTGGGGNSLRLTSSQAVRKFLPSGSTPRPLDRDFVDPTRQELKNVLAGQLVALTLNVTFDGSCAPEFGSGGRLAGLKLVGGPCSGMTVAQVLSEGNTILGGDGGAHTPSQINRCATAINENFADGGDQGNLR